MNLTEQISEEIDRDILTISESLIGKRAWSDSDAKRIDRYNRYLRYLKSLCHQVEKHIPFAFNDQYYCGECKIDDNDNMVWYPCPFIKEVAYDLGIQSLEGE